MKVGRNSPCHCGSGKKYKQCHGFAEKERKGRWSAYAMLIGAIVIIVVLGELLVSIWQEEPAAADGRIWSTEHGHWHDAQGREIGGATGGPQAAPPGPAPAGKVWSAEHGHWHDA